MTIRRWISSLTDLFYPNLCVACERELSRGEAKICTYCRWDLPYTYYFSERDNYVTELFAGRFPFENAGALIYFKGSGAVRPNGERCDFRQMIHRMKYSSRSDVAFLLGEILGRTLLESPLYQDIDMLIPVPLHWTRRLSRGYNQSEEICRGISAVTGIPFNTKLLCRNKFTRQQARRTRNERWKNVRNAFVVKPSAGSFDGKHLLIVDDVLTTGSTIEACADALLRRSESVRISIATVAVAESSKGRTSHGIEDSPRSH